MYVTIVKCKHKRKSNNMSFDDIQTMCKVYIDNLSLEMLKMFKRKNEL